jgi:hypothetical protein
MPLCVQSASTEYFKKARRFLAEVGRDAAVTHAVINPDDVVQDNLLTACHNTDELLRSLLDVRAGADAALTAVAAAVRGDALPSAALRGCHGGGGDGSDGAAGDSDSVGRAGPMEADVKEEEHAGPKTEAAVPAQAATGAGHQRHS